MIKNTLFKLSILLLLFSACSSKKETTEFLFRGEKGTINYYNFEKSEKPVAVIIPAVFNSLINQQTIEDLAKKYRLAVVRFPNDSNLVRLQSIDRMENRTNYYTNALVDIIEKSDTISTLFAEGDNSNIALLLAQNIRHPKVVLLNSWYPNIKRKLTNQCYSKTNTNCDSLLSYLNFSSRTFVDSLFTNITTKGTDNLYGNYTSDAWKDYLTFDATKILSRYKNNVVWVYTTNTGLLSEAEYKILLQSHGPQKNVQLISLKEFYKKKPLSSN